MGTGGTRPASPRPEGGRHRPACRSCAVCSRRSAGPSGPAKLARLFRRHRRGRGRQIVDIIRPDIDVSRGTFGPLPPFFPGDRLDRGPGAGETLQQVRALVHSALTESLQRLLRNAADDHLAAILDLEHHPSPDPASRSERFVASRPVHARSPLQLKRISCGGKKPRTDRSAACPPPNGYRAWCLQCEVDPPVELPQRNGDRHATAASQTHGLPMMERFRYRCGRCP